jgi:hypothetical protein
MRPVPELTADPVEQVRDLLQQLGVPAVRE